LSKINLSKYQTLIFDCDGVLLNSNKIKTQAFYEVAKEYGHESAQALQDYHVLNGGISRYRKFEFFLTNILQKPIEQLELNKLLSKYSEEVKGALLLCEIAPNIKELRSKTKHSKWLVVSGGDQGELREVFKKRGLTVYFNGGIFGSPDSKDMILKTEKNKANIVGNSLFLGDSMYDYQSAIAAQIDFIFLSKWTEVVDWENVFNDDQVYLDIGSLLGK
tara:strand:- start:1288 stop:1944 length:657 start_codon:yes stop_codon:yes gene_type:complete